MNERFESRMQEKEVSSDVILLGDFTEIYCKGNHKDRDKKPLESDGFLLGVYGTNPPVVCEECAELLRYAEKRRANCPKDPKPFCSHCDTHCYGKTQRVQVQEVMRYAGPRSLGTKHAITSLRHLIEGLRNTSK